MKENVVRVKLNENGWKIYREKNGIADSNVDSEGYCHIPYDYFEVLFFPLPFHEFSDDIQSDTKLNQTKWSQTKVLEGVVSVIRQEGYDWSIAHGELVTDNQETLTDLLWTEYEGEKVRITIERSQEKPSTSPALLESFHVRCVKGFITTNRNGATANQIEENEELIAVLDKETEEYYAQDSQLRPVYVGYADRKGYIHVDGSFQLQIDNQTQPSAYFFITKNPISYIKRGEI